MNFKDSPTDPDLTLEDLQNLIASIEQEVQYAEEMAASLPDLRAKLLVANRELDKKISEEIARFDRDRGEMADVAQVQA